MKTTVLLGNCPIVGGQSVSDSPLGTVATRTSLLANHGLVMPVIINSNSSATIAAANLADSSRLLQKSLNRLSSGSKIIKPSDDAGGLAVATKLAAAARRQSAASSNISNTVSYLQTQDGGLKVASKILDRVSELKTLSLDPTKSSSDIANYNSEFTALQAQLTAIAGEKFNAISLFGSASIAVGTNEGSTTSITTQAVNLLGTAAVPWSNVGMTPSDWTASSGSITNPSFAAGSGALAVASTPTVGFHQAGTGTYRTNQNIAGPFTLEFDTSSSAPGSYSGMTISAGGGSVNLTALLGGGGADHHVSIVDNGTTASISIDGGTATVVASLATPAGGAFVFTNAGFGGGDFHIGNIALTNTDSGSNSVASVLAGSSLSALSLSSVTGAIADIATYRARNGASQSQLGFASELLSVNKANLEAATSRITDVDVAEESTQLARYNILVQSGTAMLSQANQSAQMALRLLT